MPAFSSSLVARKSVTEYPHNVQLWGYSVTFLRANLLGFQGDPCLVTRLPPTSMYVLSSIDKAPRQFLQ